MNTTTTTSSNTNNSNTNNGETNANCNHNYTGPRDTTDFEKSLTDLVGLGRVWARYGLEAGSRALDASSKSLKVTSAFLQQLSDEVECATTPSANTAPAEKVVSAAKVVPARDDAQAAHKPQSSKSQK
jgi:hypothetical protein